MKIDQEKLNKKLSDAFSTSIPEKVDLNSLKMIIFSDQHKGQKDKADDFLKCKPNYHAALGYYFEAGYHLMVLGDVEELWECRPKKVIKAHADTFKLERKFVESSRYSRIVGNHDDMWDRNSEINKYLKPLLGSELNVYNGKHLKLSQNGTILGSIFITHGHQGSTTSDLLRVPARFLVRNIWGPIQRATNIRSTTPATDFDVRSSHELAMIKWIMELNSGGQTGKVIMIAGHTHHPVFASETHACYLEGQIGNKREEISQLSDDPIKREELYCLVAELEHLRVKIGGNDSKACGDKPFYFNSGCCAFSNGAITGIEINDGSISLVRWPDYDEEIRKHVLRTEKLVNIFSKI